MPNETYEFAYDGLFAGDFDVVTKAVTVASGAGALVKGSVLGLVEESGKANIVNSANTDGTQTPYGILSEDVDASSGDVETIVYLSGEFVSTALTFGGTDTASTHEKALRDSNIYLKTAVPA